ncbi:hypothetical protein N780_04190 [Pontibacillus chungwhensis BH030062]|uniref:Uncharacterized protein n=1 Tax=Pontibacillus chungwhensis BH030062 TaxID=1385513 RepID=A0A0A2UQL9_9BACI|nr:hypothetical protein [Pontibacillus chungwhensis]KGP90597.1 hypothetical protein N780_04190 [Pontibacillus chungwhensis BH030062]
MTKDNYYRFVTIGLTSSVIGFILLFFSTNFGTLMADKGGSDPAMYHIRIESYINSFVVSGGILFGIGLVTLILTHYIKMTYTKGQ